MRRALKFIMTLAALALLGFGTYFGARMYFDSRDDETSTTAATEPAPTPRHSGGGSGGSSSQPRDNTIKLSRLYYAICSKDIMGDNANQPLAGNSSEAQKIALCIAERVASVKNR